MARQLYIKCLAGATSVAETRGGVGVNKTTFQLVKGDQQYLAFILLNEDGDTGVAPATITGLSAARLTLRAGRYPGATLYAFQDSYFESTYGLEVVNDVQPIAPVVYFYLDLATSELTSALTNAGSITAWMEMSLTCSTGEETWFVEEITIANELYDGGAVSPPTPSPSYYTAAQVQALAQVHYDSSVSDLTATGAADCATVPTGKVFLLTALTRYIIAATSPADAETVKVGSDSDDDAATGALALTKTAAGGCETIHFADPVPFAAGAIVRVTKTVGATASAATGKYIAHGLLIATT